LKDFKKLNRVSLVLLRRWYFHYSFPLEYSLLARWCFTKQQWMLKTFQLGPLEITIFPALLANKVTNLAALFALRLVARKKTKCFSEQLMT